MQKKLLHGLAIGTAAAGIALSLWWAGWLQWIEFPTWDLRVRTFAEKGPRTDEIRLVFLDQESMEWADTNLGLSWPWPREVYSAIADFCRRSGARSLAFDVTFTETSPLGVADDERLGQTIRTIPGFATAVFLSTESGAAHWPPDARFNGMTIEGLDAFIDRRDKASIVRPRAQFPIPEIATNAAWLGSVAAESDEDGAVRRVPAFRVFDSRCVPSLALAAYLAAHPAESVALRKGDLQIGSHHLPLDAQARAILRYRGPSQTHGTVSAAAVLQSEMQAREGAQPQISPDFFKDKYVFFGFTATALLDLKSTPVDTVYPGVEVHATLLDNLLNGDAVRAARPLTVVVLTLILAWLTAVVCRFSVAAWHSAIAFVVAVPIPLALAWAAYPRGVWLPAAPPLSAVLIGLVGTIIVNYAVEGRQKRFVKNAFRQYLSPAVIDQLVKDPGHLQLGGEVRELSIFFSDIQGFTGLSENLEPQALTALLNDYLTAMTDIILESGGTVDKYEGDAIIAFWNAPLDIADHARRAVRAALDCQQRLSELRPAFRERAGKDLFARVGINTGKVVVGNMGSNQRFDYTFLGDAGNLASRLEGINKQFGTYVMISEFTRRQLDDNIAVRELSQVRVVGRREPVRVFEPMLPALHAEHRELLETFEKGLHAYYEGRFTDAAACFESIAENDPPARAYLARARKLEAEPPDDWDGIWEMTEK